MMDKEEAEFILSFLDPEISSMPRRINAMNIGLRGSVNAMVLLGEPGNGKSDAMEAIAALLDPDWSIHHIEEEDLHKHAGARGDSSIEFKKLLDAMRQGNGKNFIIMDELNGYLEHFNSPHHDTDSFGRVFWKMLDKHLEKPEYFLIGSVNEFDKVPQQVKSRLIDCIFDIPGFTSPEHLSACLRKIQSKRPEFFMEDGNNEYILQRFIELGIRTPRDTRSLMYSAFGQAATFAQDYNHIPVQRVHIDKAIARRQRIAEKIKYGQKVMSDEERRYQEQKQIQEQNRQEDIARQERYRAEDIARHNRERADDEFRANINTAASVTSAAASIATIGNALRNNPQAVETGMQYAGQGLKLMMNFVEATNPIVDVSGSSEPCSIQ